jgi:putative membrane protein
MVTDLFLAILHHLLVFGLVTLVVAEGVLLRGDLSALLIERLARIDRSYGLTAVLVIVVGICRVIFGAKGYEYYVGNPWFWAKMASFVAVGLLSIAPTMRILAWQRAAKSDAAYLAPADEKQAALFYVRAESLFIVLVLVFAATVARFG